MNTQKFFIIFFIIILFFASGQGVAEVVEYDLVVEHRNISINGKTSRGMTINRSVPGPVLTFTEGDFARIKVHNKMAVETSIHWHGLLVPPEMDGVPYVSFPPIKPGTTFIYEFPVRQSGTYWYHSHTHLQEQRGLYGGIVIKPETSVHHPDVDSVVLLSDWTTEEPDVILKTLKSGNEWYAIQKGSGQSILGAVKAGAAGSYFKRELQRMPPMDIADVAYDFFLANGNPEHFIQASSGDTVRLRIINGSATTYFYVEFAGGALKIISADGQLVQPVNHNRFLVGVAETYDVMLTLPGNGAYEFRATAQDGSGFSSVWIGSGRHFPASDVPGPDLYNTMSHEDISLLSITPQGVMGMPDHQVENGMFDRPGMAGQHQMDHMKTAGGHGMSSGRDSRHKDHTVREISSAGSSQKEKFRRGGKRFAENFHFLGTDVSSSQGLARDGTIPERPWPPYAGLRSIRPTSFSTARPVRKVRLTLDGDMERYVWFLNKKPLSESDFIRIKKGEVVQFIMVNRTMMHHPMHLHGHFFRVLNGHKDYAPLKHTVDIAPMTTTVIEFDANEFGDWFFHCHLLYHMKSGMARVVHYDNFTPSAKVTRVRRNLYKDPWYVMGRTDILSNMTEGVLKAFNTRYTLAFQWEAGWQNVDDTAWEGAVTLDRYINRFFSLFAGMHSEGMNSKEHETKGVAGFYYLLPMSIESGIWLDTEGEARVFFDKEFQLTPRVSLAAESEYDTAEKWEAALELGYILNKNISLRAKYHSEYKWGAGISLQF